MKHLIVLHVACNPLGTICVHGPVVLVDVQPVGTRTEVPLSGRVVMSRPFEETLRCGVTEKESR